MPSPVTPALYPPTFVVHADWSVNPAKRWFARAERQPDGHYLAQAPRKVENPASLLGCLRDEAGVDGCVLIGFDFPIGLPLSYARKVGVDDFLTLLPHLGSGEWADFFSVAEWPEQITPSRPFYPARPGSARQCHLTAALGVESIGDLRRRCERITGERRAAAPLFWTLGGQQVGKAAINGWKEVLQPALRDHETYVSIWPFDGRLDSLLAPGRVVVAETYPAEFYRHLCVQFTRSRPGARSGKRVGADRAANAGVMFRLAEEAGVVLTPDLRENINTGFGSRSEGEDPYDAVVGLFGMLNVVLGHRDPGEPDDEHTRRIEGWILGQQWKP